jgi:hypothetical protein
VMFTTLRTTVVNTVTQVFRILLVAAATAFGSDANFALAPYTRKFMPRSFSTTNCSELQSMTPDCWPAMAHQIHQNGPAVLSG